VGWRRKILSQQSRYGTEQGTGQKKEPQENVVEIYGLGKGWKMVTISPFHEGGGEKRETVDHTGRGDTNRN